MNLCRLPLPLVVELEDAQDEHLEILHSVLRPSPADMIRRDNSCLVDTLAGDYARRVCEDVALLRFTLGLVAHNIKAHH